MQEERLVLESVAERRAVFALSRIRGNRRPGGVHGAQVPLARLERHNDNPGPRQSATVEVPVPAEQFNPGESSSLTAL